MGLLLPHIFTVSIYPDMVSICQENKSNHTGGGKRNVIQGFSKESRYRLFRLFHSLEFGSFTFVTLTYGANFPSDGRIYKRHLQAYRRAFERRWGKVRAIWRYETQSRGAGHFHVLYLDPPFIPIQDLEGLWHKARGIYGLEKTRNSCDIRINRKRGSSDVVSKYLGKYISKVDTRDVRSDTSRIGRIWGKWNINEPEPIKLKIDRVELEKLNQAILHPNDPAKWQPLDQNNYTCFGLSMGSGSFRNMVLSTISRIMSEEPNIWHKNVTYVTTNS